MNKDALIYIAGHKGALGHALWDKLQAAGYTNLLGCELPELDMTDNAAVKEFFRKNKPDCVILLAALAAGINFRKTNPVEMLLVNLQITINVLSEARAAGVQKFINISSALLYPSEAAIPIRENSATHVNLEELDTSYTLAKSVGAQLCRYYRKQYAADFYTVVPCNFFGPYSPFEGDKAGVIASLIRKMHEAKLHHDDHIEVWGTGNACREFLSVLDVADALTFLVGHDVPYDLVNIGRNEEHSIREVAQLIKKVVGFEGELRFDTTKPEGRMHMQLDTERLFNLGWRPKLTLEQAIQITYDWYLQQEGVSAV